jgi:hypothetical protein
MRILRTIVPAAALLAAFLLSSSLSFATKEISKKESKPCATCHVKAGQKDLNDTGKYYKEKKTLEGAPKK